MKHRKHGKKRQITKAQLKRLRAIRGFLDTLLKK